MWRWGRKKKIKKIYSDNEIKHQQNLREKYNPEDAFKTKQKQEQEQIENEISAREIQKNVAMIEYKKETLIDKIKKFFANIFKK